MNNRLKFTNLPNTIATFGLTLGLVLISSGFNYLSPTKATETLSLEVYWQQMEVSLSMVSELVDADLEHTQDQLEMLAAQWEDVDAVLLPDGVKIALDHSFLIQQLRLKPPDLTRIQDLLTQLIQTARAWPPGRNNPSDLFSLQAILDQPEFNWSTSEPSPLQKWWEDFQMKILEFILNLLPGEVGVNFGGSLLNWVLIAVSLLVLTFVLFFIGRSLFSSFVKEAEILTDDDAHPGPITAEQAIQQAQALSQVGDYRTAVRFLYLSALLSIAERGILRFDPSKTNREVLQSIHHLPYLLHPLKDVVDVFDRVWYGYQPIDSVHYAHYAARVDELKRLKA